MRRVAWSAIILTASVAQALAGQSYRTSPHPGPQYAVDRGAWSIGGIAGTDRTHFDDGGHIFQFYVAPSGEYFVAPGVALRAVTGLTRVTDSDHGYVEIGRAHV